MTHDLPNQSDKRSSLENSLLLAQYQSLRNEIVSLVTARYQTVQISIIAIGTAIAAAVQFENPSIILAYPVLAFILARSWATDDRSIRRLAAYIADRIEKPFALTHDATESGYYRLDWESFMRSSRRRKKFDSLFNAALGLFFVCELTAVIVGILIFARNVHQGADTAFFNWLSQSLFTSGNILFLGLLICDVICMLATIIVMATIHDYDFDKQN